MVGVVRLQLQGRGRHRHAAASRHLLAATLHALDDERALLGDKTAHREVVDRGVHIALHQGPAVVVFDVAHPPAPPPHSSQEKSGLSER